MAKERTSGDTDEQRALSSTGAVPLIEEDLHVGKRAVPMGRVRVRSVTDRIAEIARATLDEESVDVTRVPIGREIDSAPAVRTEDGVTIVPIIEEVLVVEKRLVLKEELHIRRTVAHEDVEVPVTLRKQRAVVERTGPERETFPDGAPLQRDAPKPSR